MITQEAYNDWAKTYDTVVNKTRDLEAIAIRTVLADVQVDKILEIGCGTGKNTLWLADKCTILTAADFSTEMMTVAQQKVSKPHVHFQQADITKAWAFQQADLITCSLVLEHVEDLDHVFAEAAKTLDKGGRFFICELHPYKQLKGTRAKFEQDGEMLHLEYFVHHISDYVGAAANHGLVCADLQEWFDDGDRTQIPRLVSYVFRLG